MLFTLTAYLFSQLCFPICQLVQVALSFPISSVSGVSSLTIILHCSICGRGFAFSSSQSVSADCSPAGGNGEEGRQLCLVFGVGLSPVQGLSHAAATLKLVWLLISTVSIILAFSFFIQSLCKARSRPLSFLALFAPLHSHHISRIVQNIPQAQTQQAARMACPVSNALNPFPLWNESPGFFSLSSLSKKIIYLSKRTVRCNVAVATM